MPNKLTNFLLTKQTQLTLLLTALIVLFTAIYLTYNDNNIENNLDIATTNKKDVEIPLGLPSLAPTILPTPTQVPTKVVMQTTPVVVATVLPQTPANNSKPKTNILSYGLSDYTQDNDKAVQIGARATDSNDYISKVEFYIDGSLKSTVPSYSMGGTKVKLLSNPEDIFDITSKIGKWLEDKKDDGKVTYVSRDSLKWNNSPCGVSEGYYHIMFTNNKVYDVRTSKDLKNNEICREGESMNIDDLYYYMWQKPKSGKHKVYVKAYDKYGASTKSEEVEFRVE